MLGCLKSFVMAFSLSTNHSYNHMYAHANDLNIYTCRNKLLFAINVVLSKSILLLYLIQERLHETETHDTIKVAIPEDEPPNSPPTCEPLQASTHVTEKYNKGLHESVTKG